MTNDSERVAVCGGDMIAVLSYMRGCMIPYPRPASMAPAIMAGWLCRHPVTSSPMLIMASDTTLRLRPRYFMSVFSMRPGAIMARKNSDMTSPENDSLNL